ncbi:MAG: hypothetical protein HC838_03830 [Spirulinaceae cyanobacterium RM2_2_10]|nr:hypothetical protein [Spirulinaceae cyanobacterium SM2_1_0]NJO19370.1 hypothetical protein [Spirulinaceae cyanobacterium RM2_2_10]
MSALQGPAVLNHLGMAGAGWRGVHRYCSEGFPPTAIALQNGGRGVNLRGAEECSLTQAVGVVEWEDALGHFANGRSPLKPNGFKIKEGWVLSFGFWVLGFEGWVLGFEF